MSKYANDEAKKQTAIRFVLAAQELIAEEGLENVSVRKIAAKAGLHNSTTYLYFNDLDTLLLLASMKQFTDYSRALNEYSQKISTPAESFFAIWEFFCNSAFKSPQLFYNFFFGKYCNDLGPIFDIYYDLFPEERLEYSQSIDDMFYGTNFSGRCLSLMEPLIEDDAFRITEDSLSIANQIIVNNFKGFLDSLRQDNSQDIEVMTKQMLSMLHFIVDKL